MGKTARGAAALGILFTATLLVPGTARAADPAVAGSCAGTGGSGSSPALTVDAGAPVGAPGTLTIGTGSNSAPTGDPPGKPLVSLPAADAAEAVGIGDTPVAGEVVTGVLCPAARKAVNTLSAATENLLTGGPPTPPGAPPGPVPRPPEPSPPVRTPVPPPVAEPAPGPGGTSAADTAAPQPSRTGPMATLAILLPVEIRERTPASPSGLTPPVAVGNSGPADVSNAPWNTPARLPLLLAVFALALVSTALARDWGRRKTA
ncbi:MAG TPA: hypothetical protein VFG87_05870 [Amycolatopsis sp.]|nr:hypothetical protein [Amycolatopsis sp.]